MTYRRWDVVAVSFPFLEATETRRRPALIVSTDRMASEQGLYWIAMITTAKPGARRDDITVTDLLRGELPESCVIRVARLATIRETQIVRRLGDIAPKDRNAVLSLLRPM